MQYIKKTSHPRTSYAKELYTCLGRMRKRCISSIYFEDFGFIEDAYETNTGLLIVDYFKDKVKNTVWVLFVISERGTLWRHPRYMDGGRRH